jgi:carbon-monoxide dehydrogenase medium subunit
MYPQRFTYHRAETLNDAVRLLGSLGEDARILAGGHSLIPSLKLRLATPEHLVDISSCCELKGVRQEGGRIHIGAATTYHELETNPIIASKIPMLREGAGQIADMQVRNKGTIGGSLCNSDPNADIPVLLLALDAVLHITSPRGAREVSIHEWFHGFMTTALAADEILHGISVAACHGEVRCSYVKVKHRASRFGVVVVATQLVLANDGTVVTACLAVGGLGDAPVRLSSLESALISHPAVFADAAELESRIAAAYAQLNIDVAPSKAWLMPMARGATKASLLRASGNKEDE